MIESHQLVNQDSGNTEYYTPLEIVESAREVMGWIDLDPFSSETANKRIKAALFYDHDGLDRSWYGRMWMNHPFGRVMNAPCINRLIWHYEEAEIEQACCITFAATSEKWFRPLLDYPQCFLYPRTNYINPDGSIKKGVTKGSVVTYLGPNVSVFCEEYSQHGKVKI